LLDPDGPLHHPLGNPGLYSGLWTPERAAATGEAAPPFSTVTTPVTVLIGGVEATVLYQGLAPGFVGLYQVNVQLPSGVAPGDASLVIRQNGIPNNPDLPVSLPVASP